MTSDLLKKALIRICCVPRDIYEMSTATTTTTTINIQGFPQRSLPDFHMEVLENDMEVLENDMEVLENVVKNYVISIRDLPLSLRVWRGWWPLVSQVPVN